MSWRGLVTVFFLMELVVASVGCDRQQAQSEQYVMDPADISLSLDNHPHGYGKSQCFLCHIPNNIHTVNRLGHTSFDLAQSLVKRSGLASCSGCHGKNGVSP